jgi:hypothetical protein
MPSTPATPANSPPPRPWPEQWAIQVAVEADRIEGRMRIALAAERPDGDHRASREAIEHHLAEARAACRRPPRRWSRGLRDRWRGTSVEQAYRNTHSAKVFLVDLLPVAELQMLAPEVGSRLAVLDRADPRRVEAERLLTDADSRTRRAALKQAMETSYDAVDEKYSRLRDFRNIILLTAALITVFIGLLTLAVERTPDAVPLCFERPAAATGTGPQGLGNVCPSGLRQSPSPGDMPIVAGLGAIGGLLAALLSIRTLRGTSVPYGIPGALALLKVPAGMLTAVAGILLFGGGFVPGLSNLDSQRQILAYALVFGYAQQLITRLVDDRAQSILNKIPSKDAEAGAAEPPAGPAAAPVAPAAPGAPPTTGAPAARRPAGVTPVNQRSPGTTRPADQPAPGNVRPVDQTPPPTG